MSVYRQARFRAPGARSALGRGPASATASTLTRAFPATSFDAAGRMLGPTQSSADVAPGSVPLPLPTLLAPATQSTAHYVVTAIDDRGRLGDTSAVDVLGWTPGQPMAFLLLPDAAGVVVEPGGPAKLTGRRRLPFPVAVRRALHLEPGDRMLVAAHPDCDVLVAYTMAALDAMTSWLHGAACNQPTDR